MSWFGLQCVIVVFPDHYDLLFDRPTKERLGLQYFTNLLFYSRKSYMKTVAEKMLWWCLTVDAVYTILLFR